MLQIIRAGCIFYRITAEDYIDTKKMVLSKIRDLSPDAGYRDGEEMIFLK
jgi:hypothetical protein